MLTSIEKKVRELVADGVDLTLSKNELSHEAVATYYLTAVLMEILDELKTGKGV
jgi:hypothetical protein